MLDELHDPGLLRGINPAVRRLREAVTNDEMVVVHGDYDVDGITGSVLLASWIRALGGQAEAIVPDRQRDGYDLSEAGVARAAKLGARVLVTVDCGVMAHEPVGRAARAGMTVIVTDHHRSGDTLPDALAVVNPNQPGCPYPNKDLCGAGVAFKIGQLLARSLGRPDREAWAYLDLVALATIADQVRLAGENRVLARYGLRVLATTNRAGLQALKQEAGIQPGTPIDSATVAFGLAPRINAAGRVGNAMEAVSLLLTRDPIAATRLAATIEGHNQRRRTLENEVASEAMAQLSMEAETAPAPGVVIDGEGWHSGVIGIVASRIVERIFRPVVVIAFDGDAGRGSGRSIPSCDLHAAIASCGSYLERFGGHHQAAGLDIRRQHLPAFRAAFVQAVNRELRGLEPVPELRADMTIPLGAIDDGFYNYLRYFGPFGLGNPEPVFVSEGVEIKYPKVVKDAHFKFRMTRDRAGLGAIGFGLAETVGPEFLGGAVPKADVAFNLMANTFRGNTRIEAKVRDVRPAR